MLFRRKTEKRPDPFRYQRILVPLLGDPRIDDAPLHLTVLLTAGVEGAEVLLLHVIEVPFDRNLDSEDESAVARADEILTRAESMLTQKGLLVRTSTVQARAAGPAIVDDAAESRADLIVMGLAYKQRFGGQWHAGRTVPYVMRNTAAPVWCLRAETKELARTS